MCVRARMCNNYFSQYISQCSQLIFSLLGCSNLVREVITFWIELLQTFNSRKVRPPWRPPVIMYTDACDQGGGMITNEERGYVNWRIDMPSIARSHINVKETMAVILAGMSSSTWIIHLHAQQLTKASAKVSRQYPTGQNPTVQNLPGHNPTVQNTTGHNPRK